MRIVSTTFWMPKDGNSPDEYEDAAYPREETHDEWDTFKCAIADGATETSFAGEWAKLLVEGYVREEALTSSQRKWSERVEGKELAWYAEQKLEAGAFAAFAGLSLNDDGSWYATACGDCCIFQLRDTDLVESFPLNSADEFSNRPILLSSRGENPREIWSEIDGNWTVGDTFLLMTDALAKWFLQRYEASDQTVLELEELLDQQSLISFVADIRRTNGGGTGVSIGNDDVTLMRIIIGD